MIKEEITKERIDARIRDLELSARHFVEDLEAFAMQQALKQMQVKDDNTDLIDDAVFYDIEGSFYAMNACEKAKGIQKSLINLLNAWFTMRCFTDDEVKKILENSEKNLRERVNEKINNMIKEAK